ncbi:MAG: PKD domain-containing protein [Nitrospirota bacterium]
MIRSYLNEKNLCVLLTVILIVFNSISLFAAEVTLSWEPSTMNSDYTPLEDLDGYIVYLGNATGDYAESIYVGNVTTYSVNGLTEGLTYYFAVTAINSSGSESEYSNETNKYVESIDSQPPVISGVYADNITRSNATINWTTNEAADTQIEYGTTLSYGYITSPDPVLVNTHIQTISVAPSTEYFYRVLSRDASGNLAVSGSYVFTSAEQLDLTLPVISNVQVTNLTSSSATISWMTDEASTSMVEYGIMPNYESITSNDQNLVTIHSVDIAGLSSYTAYTFRVISMDSAYNDAVSGNYSFTTSNLPPKINTYSANPATGFVGMVANFTSSSLDADGYIARHEWDFDGDGIYDEDTGAITGTSVIYAEAGSYNARLRVTDNSGSSVISGIVTVTVDGQINQPPVISSVSATPSTGKVPLTVTLSADASDSDETNIRYEWDFDGNGIYDAEIVSNPVTYVYNSPGNYPVRVRVTDNDGSTATGEVIVHVRKGKGHGSGGKVKKR